MAFLRASLTVPSSTIASSLPWGSFVPLVCGDVAEWRGPEPKRHPATINIHQCGVQTVTGRRAALFVLMVVVWGLPYMLIKVAVRDLSPAVVVEARTAIGALVLLPLAVRQGQLRPLLSVWKPF